MAWFIIALITPILVAWYSGTTYAFAFSVSGIGIIFYFLNIFLIRRYLRKRAPQTLSDDSWELTSGTGLVPRWVSVFGLIGVGFIPAGLIVALLLWLQVIINKST